MFQRGPLTAYFTAISQSGVEHPGCAPVFHLFHFCSTNIAKFADPKVKLKKNVDIQEIPSGSLLTPAGTRRFLFRLNQKSRSRDRGLERRSPFGEIWPALPGSAGILPARTRSVRNDVFCCGRLARQAALAGKMLLAPRFTGSLLGTRG